MPGANWLEVSVTVDGEMAEAVAEVLSRFAPNGVAMEATSIATDIDNIEGRPVGPLRVCGYLPVDETLEETRQRVEESLWYLGRIRPLPLPQFTIIEEADWTETWKQNYRPIPVGENLLIVPAWMEPTDSNRIPVLIDPGMAFGTGTHPTTQLCLEMMQSWMQFHQTGSSENINSGRDRDKPNVIDVGCGSGILSIAALKLGAGRVLGVDIDPEAIIAAQVNATLNEVNQDVKYLEFGTGSITEIRDGSYSMVRASLVVVNILAPVIVNLLEENLVDLVAPEGHLILSGMLEDQTELIEAALQKAGLIPVSSRQMGDWVALGVDVR